MHILLFISLSSVATTSVLPAFLIPRFIPGLHERDGGFSQAINAGSGSKFSYRDVDPEPQNEVHISDPFFDI